MSGRGLVSRRLSLWQMLRHPSATGESRESAALLVGGAVLIVTTIIALMVFWGRTLAITGPGSIGQFVAIGSALVAIVIFVMARWVADAGGTDNGLLPRLRWFDSAGIALAHGIVALLGWIGMAALVERSFVGAVVFPVSGAILAGVAVACTAYVVVLSAVRMTPARLSLVLMVFLVVGVFASMLSASDDQWWKKNLSSLGITDDISALTFNVTIIVAGLIVTTIAHFGTAGIPAATPKEVRGRRVVRIELLLIGVLLAGVGIFPVDRFFAVHNVAACGMAVVFVVMVLGLRRCVPRAPRVFVFLGYGFVLCIVVLAVLLATGYYNLTAVELIAFVIIFAWLLLFLRNAGDPDIRDADPEVRRTEPEVRDTAVPV